MIKLNNILKVVLSEAENNKRGRRYIPKHFLLSDDTRKSFPNQIKLVRMQDTEKAKIDAMLNNDDFTETGYRLLISPLFKTALDGITRGRSTDFAMDGTVGQLREKIPTQVRGPLKKSVQGQKIVRIGDKDWVPSLLIIGLSEDGDVMIFNPSVEGMRDLFEDE